MQADNRNRSPELWLSVLMAFLVTVSVDIAMTGYHQELHILILRSVGLVTLTLLIRPLMARWLGSRASFERSRKPQFLAACLFFAPSMYSLLRTLLGYEFLPLEQSLLTGVLFLLLFTFVFPEVARLRQMRSALGLFLMISAVAIGVHDALDFLLAAYALTGTLWLLVHYWCDLDLPETQRGSFGWTKLLMTMALLIVVGSFWLGHGNSKTLGTGFANLLPSSGGGLFFNSRALDGIGDGHFSTSGENADSTGFTEEDVFMKSSEDSLYDLATEIFGKPRNKDSKKEAAIVVDRKKVTFIHKHREHTKDHRANRSFEMLRHTPRRKKEVANHEADALMFVEGRTPLHLRLAAYDSFDGVTWSEEALQETELVARGSEDHWFDLFGQDRGSQDQPLEKHAVKIGKWVGRRLPLPANTQRFRIGKIDRADWFHYAQNDILQMIRSIPAGNAVEMEGCPVDTKSLTEWNLSSVPGQSYLELPEALSTEACQILTEWADSGPMSHAHVAKLVERIRSHAKLNRHKVVPEHLSDPTLYFLQEAKEAPSYLFASTATLLLRHAGYPARMVSGFYADPEKYNYTTNHTPVHKEDLHYWVEALMPDGTWLPMDPCPGHHVLAPKRTLAQMWSAMTEMVFGLLASNYWTVVFVLLLGAVLWMQRVRLLDAFATAFWRLQLLQGNHVQVLATVRLLEYRARLSRRARASGQAYGPWMRALVPAEDGGSAALRDEFIRLANRAMYDPEHRPNGPAKQDFRPGLWNQVSRMFSIQHMKCTEKRKGGVA